MKRTSLIVDDYILYSYIRRFQRRRARPVASARCGRITATGGCGGNVGIDAIQDNASGSHSPCGCGTALTFLPLTRAQATHLDTDPDANPNLPDQCGIDVVLLMDSSGSISTNPPGSSEADDIEAAYFAFLNALSGTGARAGVIDFDTTATVEINAGPAYLSITGGNIAGAFTTYMNGFTPGGFTNWDDAFTKADGFSPAPDLVVLITDGDPTTHGDGTVGIVAEDVALEPAIAASNTLKGEGTHILAVGVGSTPDEDNLTHVSGNDIFDTNVSAINAMTVPGLDVIITDFADLEAALAKFAESLCAEIQITKTGSFTSGDGSSVGDTITYTFEIENTGAVDLSNVDLTDPQVGLDGATCDATTDLAPAETTTCTATYNITQDDIDAGQIDNLATTTGEAPQGTPVEDDDPHSVDTIQNPAIMLDRTGSFTSGDGSSVGDTITYSFTITNTGNVTLTGVDLTLRRRPGL